MNARQTGSGHTAGELFDSATHGRRRRDGWTVWRPVADVCKRSRAVLWMADRLGRGRGRWPWEGRRPASPPDATGPQDRRRPEVWPVAGASEAFATSGYAALPVGHATVLYRFGGTTVLTDPVFSSRIGLRAGRLTAGPRRLRPTAIMLDELPAVDVVLVSHAHFDHLDRPTLDRLALRFPNATVVTAAGCIDLLDDLGFGDVRALGWGQSTRCGELHVTAIPAKHWGARVFADTHRGYAAFLLEHRGVRVLFGGDSAFFDGWRDVGAGGGVDLACVGIGAYDPYIAAHATPEQAVEMAALAGARAVMPMHYGVFRLSHEPMDEPLRRFQAAADRMCVRRVADAIGRPWTWEAAEGCRGR
ncbi:MAG: MBL fold metallo-hydrolase [Tepidisphaerales bacterium]